MSLMQEGPREDAGLRKWPNSWKILLVSELLPEIIGRPGGGSLF